VVKYLIILLTILSSGLNSFCQNEFLSGLYFSSYEVIQEKRTSLNLTPFSTCKFNEGISLEMEANFRRGDGYYGYIFRIIGDDHTNIDLISNLASTSSNFWLVLKDKILFSYKWSDIPQGNFNSWIKIRIEIDVKNSRMSIWINGKKQEGVASGISRLKNYSLVFGASDNSSFYNTDVCPMSLKNIRIFDSKNKLIRDWKLSKHSQSKVYDETNNEEALVKNPIWIMDKHIKWNKFKDFKFENILGITQDEENGRIYFIDHNAVYILSTKTSHIDTIPFAGGLPYFELGKQIIYNKFTNELWSYNFSKNKISKFNFSTRKWSLNDALTILPDFWHHNKFISPLDSSLITLFGYGHYIYKSIINRYDAKTSSWEKTDRSTQIQPRYLSGVGFLNNQEMLVFGGYGSKSGQQELSPEFYYDLYSFNLKDYSFKKLWTLIPPLTPFVPCEALIPDQKSGSFYTLLYNRGTFATSLQLAKFEIKNGQHQLFKDSIPYSFLDTESWSTLFLDHETSQLIAITAHNSDVAIYTIAYPPLMPVDVYQNVKWKWYIWMILGLLIFVVISFIFILLKKKKHEKKNEDWKEKVDHPSIVPFTPKERITASSIYFMGGFQIYDRIGHNITGKFSPTLKQLFLYIFLNTIKNGKGVSSTELDEVLWYDKIGESARNNRNVNISKLRTALDEIGGVELTNENSFWEIKLGNEVFCDYLEILRLLRKSKTISLSLLEMNELISLIMNGEFLSQIQTKWIVGVKSQFVSEIIEELSSLFNIKEEKNDLSLRYHIAECILVLEPLSDEAFAMKCSILYHLGKKGTAKNMYDSFSREYKQVLGIPYDVSFNDIIKQKD
jgi:two-component SAPR family response regulator